LPAIRIHNRQRAVKIDVEQLQRFGERALALCESLATVARIDVVLISDRRMSALHRRFLKMTGPTDVITFQHGEIFISAEMARRQARTFGKSPIEEIQLYLVHGLLHLGGFDDKTTSAARAMRRTQEKIVRAAR
jgi:probable rRNA maturation factor